MASAASCSAACSRWASRSCSTACGHRPSTPPRRMPGRTPAAAACALATATRACSMTTCGPGSHQRGRKLSSGNSGRCTPIHRRIMIRGPCKGACRRRCRPAAKKARRRAAARGVSPARCGCRRAPAASRAAAAPARHPAPAPAAAAATAWCRRPAPPGAGGAALRAGSATCHSSSAPQLPLRKICSALHSASALRAVLIHSRRSCGKPQADHAAACGAYGGCSSAMRCWRAIAAKAGRSNCISPIPGCASSSSISAERGQPPPGSSGRARRRRTASLPSGCAAIWLARHRRAASGKLPHRQRRLYCDGWTAGRTSGQSWVSLASRKGMDEHRKILYI